MFHVTAIKLFPIIVEAKDRTVALQISHHSVHIKLIDFQLPLE